MSAAEPGAPVRGSLASKGLSGGITEKKGNYIGRRFWGRDKILRVKKSESYKN